MVCIQRGSIAQVQQKWGGNPVGNIRWLVLPMDQIVSVTSRVVAATQNSIETGVQGGESCQFPRFPQKWKIGLELIKVDGQLRTTFVADEIAAQTRARQNLEGSSPPRLQFGHGAEGVRIQNPDQGPNGDGVSLWVSSVVSVF